MITKVCAFVCILCLYLYLYLNIRIKVKDDIEADIGSHFDAAVNFIKRAEDCKGRVSILYSVLLNYVHTTYTICG